MHVQRMKLFLRASSRDLYWGKMYKRRGLIAMISTVLLLIVLAYKSGNLKNGTKTMRNFHSLWRQWNLRLPLALCQLVSTKQKVCAIVRAQDFQQCVPRDLLHTRGQMWIAVIAVISAIDPQNSSACSYKQKKLCLQVACNNMSWLSTLLREIGRASCRERV